MGGGNAQCQQEKHESILFCDFVKQRYLPFIQENVHSWKISYGNLKLHILPYLGSYRLTEIDSDILASWINSLQLSGLACSSCRRQLSVVKHVLNCAVHWGELKSDTAFKNANMPYKKCKVAFPVLLKKSELFLLLDILKQRANSTQANAILLMLLTGASKSEILGAKWEDVDLKNGTLTIKQNFSGNRCIIPLNTDAIMMIQSLPRQDNLPWLFCTHRGTQLKDITRYWQKIRQEIGLPELQLQDLRHYRAIFD